jgi:EAL domain-containing protein (putative c-di-GMP-specific phosphodiesterase class I)
VIAPRDLIPVAEESGLIHPLGAWILEEACTQNAAWQIAGYQPVPVAVNVSAVQFSRGDLCASVALALQRSRLDPQWLEIEITESVMLDDEAEHTRALDELKAMGVRIALDDFGTGYSSLNYLTRIPFDTLKLDRSFIRNVESDSRSKCIVLSVIAMAHGLGVRIVAEGVDSEEQESFLRSHGCDEIQGFLFSASLAPEDFVRFLPRGTGYASDLPADARS